MTLISNPQGAHRTVTTFVAGQDDGGEALIQPAVTQAYRANEAIVRGQVCAWVAPTASVPLSVKPMATADNSLLFAGVALDNADAGQSVQLAQLGHALVRTGDVTTQLGHYLVKPASTAGVGTLVSDALDATDVVGAVLGVVLGSDDGTFTPVYLTRL